MMTAELDHPGRCSRGRAQKRDVVFVESETNSAAALAAACGRALASTGLPASGVFEHFIAIHDVGDFLIAVAAQRRGDQRERRGSLALGEIAETQAVALKDAGGKIRPAGRFLAAVEGEGDLRLLCGAERREKIVRGSNRFGRDGRLRAALDEAPCNRRHESQGKEQNSSSFHRRMVVGQARPREKVYGYSCALRRDRRYSIDAWAQLYRRERFSMSTISHTRVSSCRFASISIRITSTRRRRPRGSSAGSTSDLAPGEAAKLSC